MDVRLNGLRAYQILCLLKNRLQFHNPRETKGSSGRTRTYNPPVNSPIDELLPHFAGLCFSVFLCVFAQETMGLTSCFYLP